MNSVHVILLEDNPIDLTLVDMPQDHQGYHLEWDDSMKGWKDAAPGTWIRTRDAFENYNKLLSSIKGFALIFADLGLHKKVTLTPEERDSLVTWFPMLQERQISDYQGWYLVKTALENPNWHGLIRISTSRPYDDTEIIKQIEAYGTDRVCVKKGSSLCQTPAEVRYLVNLGVGDFLKFMVPTEKIPLEKRLWPTDSDCWSKPIEDWMASTEEWFINDDVPHNFPNASDLAKLKVSKYVQNVLGFDPPPNWFKEPEYQYLWRELECLTGGSSVVQGNDEQRYRFSLGNAALLLAAVVGRPAHNWLRTICWTRSPTPMLPLQTQEQARKTVLSLMQLFKEIRADDVDKAKLLVTDVKLTENSLQIWLNLDCLSPSPKDKNGHALIQDVIELPMRGGTTSRSYRKFLVESTRAIDMDGNLCREARCVVNVMPTIVLTNMGETQQTVLEILVLARSGGSA